MDLETKLQKNLAKHLQQITPPHWFSSVYEYAVLPPGKLFRPQLVFAIEQDFQNKPNTNHALLASAIEIHHTYTLIHDDLPCMDDDDSRRGRPATHRKFGEWQALLAGDGLLNGSYQLLSRIYSPYLLRYFSWCVGTRGLIQGQVLDLAEEMKNDFKTLIKTHQFKTARLIQASIVGSYILTESPSTKIAKKLHRFGYHLGLVFQFLDDLSELSDNQLSSHEFNINPWIKFPDQSYQALKQGLNLVETTLGTYKLESTHSVVAKYFAKMKKIISNNCSQIKTHCNAPLDEIEGILVRLINGL